MCWSLADERVIVEGTTTTNEVVIYKANREENSLKSY
jgi:hypothetical protein